MRLVIFLMICFTAVFTNAQSGVDSMNIKVLVQNQIRSAQEILEQEKEKLAAFKAEQEEKQISETIVPIKKEAADNSSSAGLFLKLYFLITACFLAGLIIAYRRKKSQVKVEKEKKLKANIKLMRDEVPFVDAEDELADLRKTMLNAASMSDSANELSMGKNKLKLSKGEILLAEKVSDSNKSNRKTEKVKNEITGSKKSINKNSVETDITSKAKELKVSREEVMLAELLKKIKSSAA